MVDSISTLSDAEVELKALSKQLEENNRILRYIALGPEKIVDFIYNDKHVKMYLPYADVDRIQAGVAARKTFYEERHLRQIIPLIGPDSVVFDAGANIGNHTVFFSKICRAAKVISVEVMKQTYSILAKNIEVNGLHGVTAHNVGLGAKAGYANLVRQSQTNLGNTVVKPEDDGVYEIVSIDSFGLDKLDFLKIDVEGMHLQVLDGARETLRRCKPLIWLELRPKYGEYEPGVEKMAELGYREMKKLPPHDVIFEPA